MAVSNYKEQGVWPGGEPSFCFVFKWSLSGEGGAVGEESQAEESRGAQVPRQPPFPAPAAVRHHWHVVWPDSPPRPRSPLKFIPASLPALGSACHLNHHRPPLPYVKTTRRTIPLSPCQT